MAWNLTTTRIRVAWPDITGRRQPIPDFEIDIPPNATKLLTQSFASNNPGSWYKAGFLSLIEINGDLPNGTAEVWSELLPLNDRVWEGLDPAKSYRVRVSPQLYFEEFQFLLYHHL